MIQAIQTNWRGYRFRSRMEARWAVFFDALGLEWQYEPQGFVLSTGEPYLPDFYLPKFDGGMYVEVKSEVGDFSKAIQLSRDLGCKVLLAEGPPNLKTYEVADNTPDHVEWRTRMSAESEIAEPELIEAAFWDKYLPTGRNGCDGELRMFVWPNDDELVRAQPVVAQAMYAARSARFEHGESPK
jgi:hypothetical protein